MMPIKNSESMMKKLQEESVTNPTKNILKNVLKSKKFEYLRII